MNKRGANIPRGSVYMNIKADYHEFFDILKADKNFGELKQLRIFYEFIEMREINREM